MRFGRPACPAGPDPALAHAVPASVLTAGLGSVCRRASGARTSVRARQRWHARKQGLGASFFLARRAPFSFATTPAPSPVRSDAMGAAAARKKSQVILLERGFDISSMVLHELTYQVRGRAFICRLGALPCCWRRWPILVVPGGGAPSSNRARAAVAGDAAVAWRAGTAAAPQILMRMVLPPPPPPPPLP